MRQGPVSQVRNRVRTARAVGMMRAMIKPVAVAVVASALALSAASAHAGSKSWAAVKGSINPKANVIVGGSLGPVRSTKLFSSAVQWVHWHHCLIRDPQLSKHLPNSSN